MNRTGYLIDIQHFSVNDGDGIRTTLFFAGCNMRCQWCANPESFTTFDKILYTRSACIRCGRCVPVCPAGCGMDLDRPEERRKCIACGRCVKVCPTGARRSAIQAHTVAALRTELEKYALFYRRSGGGVTFSGGECTHQSAFLDELSEALYDDGYDLAMETNGAFNPERLRSVLDRMRLIFVDIKHMDSGEHRRWTGVGNETVLETVRKLGAEGRPLVIRVPVIAGVNATDENLRNTARFVKNHVPNPRMELLPYHSFGDVKYLALGQPLPGDRFGTPSQEEMLRWENLLENEGVRVERFR